MPNRARRSFPIDSAYTDIMSQARNAQILDRLLGPLSDSLNDEAARKLVELRADVKTQARIDRLARKCNEGRLSPAEKAEYETYVFAIDFVAILQAKARARLARP